MSDFVPSLSTIHVPSSDFPSDVLKWMKENAKGKMALKLMKCHKYFQHSEFPYFVVSNIAYKDREDVWDIIALNGQKYVYQGLESIEAFTKLFWLTDSLALSESQNLVSHFIPKVAVFDIKNLILGDQQLSFNDFKIITSGNLISQLSLYNTTINYENGEQVFIDSILKCLQNLKSLTYYNYDLPILSIDFINTYQNIDTSNLKDVDIQMFTFLDFVLFSKFMDKNRHIQYYLEFIANSLSDKETETVKNYVQKIIDVGVTEFPPPSIEFPGQNDQQSLTLNLLKWNYYEQKNSKC